MTVIYNWCTQDDTIDLSEAYEVRQSCALFGCSEAQLRDAVRMVGPSAGAVGIHLRSAGNIAVADRAARDGSHPKGDEAGH
jgi:hypothetical protein